MSYMDKEQVEVLLEGPIAPHIQKGRPYPAPLVRFALQQKCQAPTLTPPHKNMLGAVIGCITAVTGNENRYKLMRILFPWRWKDGDKVSTNDLSIPEQSALVQWAKITKDESRSKNQWLLEPEVVDEIMALGREAGVDLLDPKVKAVEVEIDPNDQRDEAIRTYGMGTFKMTCGHTNDDYNDIGRPMCKKCGLDGRTPGQWTHIFQYNTATRETTWVPKEKAYGSTTPS